jgi:hypothetical protein
MTQIPPIGLAAPFRIVSGAADGSEPSQPFAAFLDERSRGVAQTAAFPALGMFGRHGALDLPTPQVTGGSEALSAKFSAQETADPATADTLYIRASGELRQQPVSGTPVLPESSIEPAAYLDLTTAPGRSALASPLEGLAQGQLPLWAASAELGRAFVSDTEDMFSPALAGKGQLDRVRAALMRHSSEPVSLSLSESGQVDVIARGDVDAGELRSRIAEALNEFGLELGQLRLNGSFVDIRIQGGNHGRRAS